MKQMQSVVIGVSLFLLFLGCDNSSSVDKNATDFSLLAGKEYVHEIDRVSLTPDVQHPDDDLEEKNYETTNEGKQYGVVFSEDGEKVTIDPGSIRGQKTDFMDGYRCYELEEGMFSGGRFVVWKKKDNYEAELTEYGSGVPIIKSERGALERKQ